MAKSADPTTVLDPLLDAIAQCDRMSICSAQPANFAGIAGVQLGVVNMTPVTDYTKAAGDVSGRKVTVAAKNGVAITASATANHIALWRSTDSTLRYVTTCAAQAVTSGNTANVGAWKVEIGQPS